MSIVKFAESKILKAIDKLFSLKILGHSWQFSRKNLQRLQELKLSHLYIVYPGDVDYPLSENVTVVSLKMIFSALLLSKSPLKG